jgi:pilus assembly protein CpaB
MWKWKVKRMNTARIVVLANAVGAGGIAAYLTSGSDNELLPTEPVAQSQSEDVQSVQPGYLRWQTWPVAAASSRFIRRNERPNATTLVPGSIARTSMVRCGIPSSPATWK